MEVILVQGRLVPGGPGQLGRSVRLCLDGAALPSAGGIASCSKLTFPWSLTRPLTRWYDGATGQLGLGSRAGLLCVRMVSFTSCVSLWA